MVSVEKSRIRSYYGYGRPHRPHREVLRTELQSDQVGVVRAACVGRKVRNRWYRSSNRNRMMCFLGEGASVKVWESGTCRVEPRPGVDMSLKECRDFLFEKLVVAAGVNSQVAESVVRAMVPVSRHQVFAVGERMPRLRIDHYQKSLGLLIYTDASHPFALEVEEGWPSWINPLFHGLGIVTDKLAAQISGHLKLIQEWQEEARARRTSALVLNGGMIENPRPVYLGENLWWNPLRRRKFWRLCAGTPREWRQ